MKHKRQITIHYLLDKLKHGCDILSLYEGSSPSQFHQVVAVIVGVGMGVAGLYIAVQKGCLEWLNIPGESGQKGSSEFIFYIPGLQNLGNNCFLNVIIQALASCSSFYPFLQNIMIDDDLLLDQKAEKMPLRVALTSLLEDLCVVRDERTVLNPRKVMLAMGNYVSSFNLTRQQDASEAFLHLLSSLEEEVSQYYVPQDSSLAEIASSSSRIYQPVRECQSDSARWQKDYIGPLVGTISSVLACSGCSSVLSMDVESFHCLPLTPLQAKIADLVDGCTLVDCIKHFIAAEHLENYRCSQCWHNAALKYLSSKSQKDEKKIEAISNCVKLDSCDCKSLFLQEEVSWPVFSDAVKRLRIARCPKILCIHLQRASMSPHGDLIKLQGHISFPLVLDMFPFTEAAAKVKQEILFANMGNQGMNQQHFTAIHSVLQWKVQPLPHIYKISSESIASESSLRNKMRNSVCDSLEDCPPSTAKGCSGSDAILEEKVASGYGYHSSHARSMFHPEFNKPNIDDGSPDTSKKILYRLSSVVEHYGRPESGHYAVYRRLSSETSMRQWLYISDDKVSDISEEAALAAEATMLFYERIEEPL